LVLAGDEAEARQVLSGAYAQPQPNSRPIYNVAGAEPLSASHHGLTNDDLTGPALGQRLTSAAPPVAHTQPNMLSAPRTILTAPVAVARVSQWAPPDLASPAPLRASDLAPSVVDAATPPPHSSQISIPSTVTGGSDVATTFPHTSSAPTGTQIVPAKPAVSTSADGSRPASEGKRAAPEQSSGMPEGAAFVQLASLYSAQAASYEWRRLNRRMPDLLSGHEPTITRANAHGQTYWCLRTFGFGSLAGAKAMCSRMLGASGLRCWARAAS
jgi:hypothetical protein